MSTVIVIVIAVAAVAGAASAVFFITDSGDEGSFAVTYYKNGDKMLETKVTAGTFVTVYGDMGDSGSHGRFIGWNTKQDMSGKMLVPGSQMTVLGNISLYAVMLGSGVFAIVLPEEQKGFSITADPMIVGKGGSSIISYSLMPSHMDDDLVIMVNGNPIKLDAMKRIHLANITEDQIVTVTGVFDKREHSISLPEEQRGYVLTSSAEKVHHGESYVLEYLLLPGYREAYGFGIRLNGGEARMPSDGLLLIDDVMDNHTITVTGVEPIEYRMSSGKNISVLVNGIPSAKATVEDIVTILPEEWYFIPDTFDAQISGMFSVDEEGYRIAGDVAFPSVLKITSGDNVKMDGWNSGTAFVCPADTIKVVPAYGYSLPGNYFEKAKNLNGVKYSAERLSFSDDAELPSIYKVVFNGYNKVHATLFVVGGTIITQPHNNPERLGYYFLDWDVDSLQLVISDLSIMPLWGPMTFDVYFGPNIMVEIGSKLYFFEEGTDEPPRTIKIKADEKVVVKSILYKDLPDDYGPYGGKAYYIDGHYEIFGDCSFPGVTFVYYIESQTLSKVCSATIGTDYFVLLEPTVIKEGYCFTGWTCDGVHIESKITVENRLYVLCANWEPIGG